MMMVIIIMCLYYTERSQALCIVYILHITTQYRYIGIISHNIISSLPWWYVLLYTNILYIYQRLGLGIYFYLYNISSTDVYNNIRNANTHFPGPWNINTCHLKEKLKENIKEWQKQRQREKERESDGKKRFDKLIPCPWIAL